MTTTKEINYSDYPPRLRRLIKRLNGDIDRLSQRIEAGEITIEQWLDAMFALLEDFYPASWMAGQDSDELSPLSQVEIQRQLSIQRDFLENFADDVRATGWLPVYPSRARMYGTSLTAPYSNGDVVRQAGRVLPLPAMPTEGTQCLSNCKCSWRIEKLAGENNFNCYWEIGSNDQCQTCIERRRQWYPLQIRGNKVIL